MEKQKLEIIQKVLMLSTKTELQKMRESVCDAISRECDQDDREQEEFQKWRENQASV